MICCRSQPPLKIVRGQRPLAWTGGAREGAVARCFAADPIGNGQPQGVARGFTHDVEPRPAQSIVEPGFDPHVQDAAGKQVVLEPAVGQRVEAGDSIVAVAVGNSHVAAIEPRIGQDLPQAVGVEPLLGEIELIGSLDHFQKPVELGRAIVLDANLNLALPQKVFVVPRGELLLIEHLFLELAILLEPAEPRIGLAPAGRPGKQLAQHFGSGGLQAGAEELGLFQVLRVVVDEQDVDRPQIHFFDRLGDHFSLGSPGHLGKHELVPQVVLGQHLADPIRVVLRRDRVHDPALPKLADQRVVLEAQGDPFFAQGTPQNVQSRSQMISLIDSMSFNLVERFGSGDGHCRGAARLAAGSPPAIGHRVVTERAAA